MITGYYVESRGSGTGGVRPGGESGVQEKRGKILAELAKKVGNLLENLRSKLHSPYWRRLQKQRERNLCAGRRVTPRKTPSSHKPWLGIQTIKKNVYSNSKEAKWRLGEKTRDAQT